MNPIAPRKETALEDRDNDIHDPSNPAEEDIENDCDSVAIHRIIDDTVGQNQDIKENNDGK